ncbi:MAG: signal recognition particle-docking protein FtsY [Rhodospirillaceae bacterium]|jgi:fused signal recognition particle receptor|nr:signal recognition particle-docking protein FtsY [Rhodospirillaceae bacterium]MBT5373691.1 signal recognition particle-docking protein FtsY [Rhodospirillaceae bacterium]MBT5658760.1 signal recognition particle-docking protein FtsY [Rhodospirillaceae bacterium]MBT5752949.1 signal recognition particle-docking protein FtsY [Rhodospirillaceae bacterium]
MTGHKTGGWLSRLRTGLTKSSQHFSEGMTKIFRNHRLDEETLSDLEELLISSDIGVATASQLVGSLERHRFHEEISPEQLREILADNIAEVLAPVAKPLVPGPDNKPHVILVVGVNGSGKTTTIGKIAKSFREDGLEVMMAACDTFRAAAVEQLKIWSERTGCQLVSGKEGDDPAGLVFDAYKKARRKKADILLVDTAGRLQNKKGLMEELQKIVRALQKVDAKAPHSCLLVLDATTGQNAHTQVEAFREMIPVTGLVMTKFDGTAKGGVLVALADQFGLPVHAVGVGESADDLRAFSAAAFADSLMGVER